MTESAPRVLPRLQSQDELAEEAKAMHGFLSALNGSRGLGYGKLAILAKSALASLVLSTAELELSSENTGAMNRALGKAIDETVASLKAKADA